MVEESINQWQIDGDVEQFNGETAVVKVITRRRKKKYENLLEITVPEDLKDQVQVGKKLSFVGEIIRKDDADPPELKAMDIEPTNSYFNLGQALVKLAGIQFFASKPKENKPQFTSLFGDQVNGDNVISAVAFRGLSATVRGLAEGSVMMLGGQLRRRSFADGSDRYSTDIILDEAHTQIIEAKKAPTIRAINKPKAAVADGKADKPAKKSKKAV